MTIYNPTTPIEKLNQLGCTDELEAHLTQLEGIISALTESVENLDPHLIRACLWNAEKLTRDAKQISERLFTLIPRHIEVESSD